MKKLMFLMLLAAFSVACQRTDDSPKIDKKCQGVMCTEEFAMVLVQAVNAKGEMLLLKDYVAYRTSDKKIMARFEDDHFGDKGYYFIATDSDMKNVEEKGTEVTFEGTVDGKNYRTETYLIGKDCCHIKQLDNKSLNIVF